MLSLFISLAVLGLSAVDPVGIAIMPMLLVQDRPYRRAFIFLGGSFVSLMVLGVLFAKGLGRATVSFQQSHAWITPSAEAVAGVILVAIAIAVYMQLKAGKASVEPSGWMHRWLQLGDWQLFWLGALVVAIQSVVDVVFVIAMVRVGELKLSALTLVVAVAVYVVAALLLQAAVVGAFRVAPSHQKTKTLDAIRTVLRKYSYQSLIAVSLVLGLALITLSVRGMLF